MGSQPATKFWDGDIVTLQDCCLFPVICDGIYQPCAQPLAGPSWCRHKNHRALGWIPQGRMIDFWQSGQRHHQGLMGIATQIAEVLDSEHGIHVEK